MSTETKREPQFLPLTGAQRNVWYHQQLDPNSLAYNIGQVMRIEGVISPSLFIQAQTIVWKAAQCLRSRFVVIEDEPLQELLTYEDPPFEQTDLRSFDNIAEVLSDRINKHQLRSHDLSNGKCCSFALFRTGDTQWVWSMAVHHLSIDAPGGSYLTTLLAKTYKQISEHPDSEYSVEPHDWVQAVQADRDYLCSERHQKDREYWRQTMDGFETAPTLSKHPINTLDLVVPNNAYHHLSRAQYAKFADWSVANGQSLNAGFATAFCIYLNRLTGQTDLCLGSPTSGRKKNTRGLIGMLSNTTSLRAQIQPTDRVVDVLVKIARQNKQNLRHNSFPIGELTTERRKNNLTSPFSIVVNLLVFEQALDFGTASGSIETRSTGSVADLQLNIFDRNDGADIELRLDYNPAKYTASEIQNHLERISRLIHLLPQVETTLVTNLRILNDGEIKTVLKQSTGQIDQRPDDEQMSLANAFERQAKKHPQAIALHYAAEGVIHQTTYQALNEQSNQLAQKLIQQGIGPDNIVAVLLERSVEQIVSMLAVLKTGAAYLPIDPDYPAARQAFMLEDSKACSVISTSSQFSKAVDCLNIAPPLAIFLDDSNTQKEIKQQTRHDIIRSGTTLTSQKLNLAYLIYTSGSTGKPKGAGNTHEAIINRLVWMQDILQLTPSDRVLQKTSLGFDVAVWEWYLPLMTGSSLLVTTPQGHKDPNYLKQVIEQFQVTVLHFVPPMLTTFLKFLSPQDCQSIRQIVTSGEALSIEVQNETFNQFKSVKLWNLYGPTEAAIDVSAWACQANDNVTVPPIGYPIWNTQLYILDNTLEVLPEGVIGELYIAGISLARGYLGRSGLTAERFIACPFGEPGKRMYRTGDLARRRPDGAIEYFGRADDQVKIRGYRIELGEIETALLTHDANLAQVAVITRNIQGDQRLVAYLISRDGCSLTTSEQLRAALVTMLPDYMVPSYFVQIDALPLTSNGKLDRRALPDPFIQTNSQKYRPPRSSTEAILCELFAEITGAPRVGIDDGFFALGGHSLLAMKLISQLRHRANLELQLAKLFEHPTPESLAPQLRPYASANDVKLNGGIGRLDQDIVTLSYGQRRLWTLDRVEGASAAYNMAVAIHLEGRLNIQALRQALVALITRHQALRTVITESEEGAPVGHLRLAPSTEEILSVHDLSGEFSNNSAAADTHLMVLLKSLAAQPFNLQTDIPLRANLIVVQPERSVLALVMHHHAGDGMSVNIFARDLENAYRAYRSSELPTWSSIEVHYCDWAFWQQQNIEANVGPQLERARLRLADAPEFLTLPNDHPRKAERARRAEYLPIEIPDSTVQELETIALSQGTTLFTVMLAIFAATLARIASQDNIVVGTPVAGRSHRSTEDMIGLLVNTLAIPISIADNCTIRTLVQRSHDAIQLALNDQDLPFERLVDGLNVERSLSHAPVFQAMLAYETDLVPNFKFEGLSSRSAHIPLPTAKFDLILFIGKISTGKLSGNIEYDADLFDASSITTWVQCLINVAANWMPNLQNPIKTLPLLNKAQRQQTLFNARGPLVALDETSQNLPSLIDRSGQFNPTAPALIFERTAAVESMDYAELNSQSNRLARYLISNQIGPDHVIAILLDRSPNKVIAMLGVLKAGAAYLPIDPEIPVARRQFMLDDSNSKLIITSARHLGSLRSSNRNMSIAIDLEDKQIGQELVTFSDSIVTQAERLTPLLPKHLAYLIYTSGSTGIPKGTGNSHEAVVNHMLWVQSALKLKAHDRVLQKTALGFDVAVFEWFLPLMAGSTLVIATPDGHKDPEYLKNTIERHGITVIHFVASMLGMFLEQVEINRCSTLRQIVTSGEAVTGSLQEQVFKRFPAIALWDLYGPTEAAIHVAQWLCRPEDGINTPPIGHPIWNTQLFILDTSLEPVPDGVVGELYIAGLSLARGYIGRAALTAERFIANPFGESSRMYRTGDLARRRLDGAIEYLGRADDQVKIRGYRIELGEIETILLKTIDSLAQAAIITRKFSDENYIIAYLVNKTNADAIDTQSIRATLLDNLPEYMVPSYFVFIDALPLNANGKLDRKALPEPNREGDIEKFRAAQTESQILLCELFSEITSKAHVGLDDNFFAIGGHSLLAMRLVAQIRQRIGVRISLRTLFECPTPESLAPHLQRNDFSHDSELVGGLGQIDQDTVILSYGQRRLWTLDRVDGASATYNMAVKIDLVGQLDLYALQLALVALFERHQALRTVIQEAEDGTPIGRLLKVPSSETILTTYDLSTDFAKAPSATEIKLHALLETLASQPFVLHTDLPLRAHLITTTPAHHVLALTMHHHAGDGVSVKIFAQELAQAYRAFRVASRPDWPDKSVQYCDWAAWQQKTVETGIDAKLDRAKQRLSNMPELLTLPLDYPRTAQRARRASYLPIKISTQTVQQLEKIALAQETTLFTVVLAMFGTTLAKIAGQEDLVIGVPVSGRNHSSAEKIIGFLLNTLALPLTISNSLTANDLILQCRETVRTALDDQDLPFERLIDGLDLKRSFLHTPIFQAMLAFENQETPTFSLQDLECSSQIIPSTTAKFDLTLHLNKESNGTLQGTFEFDNDLFEPESVCRWIEIFLTTIDASLRAPDKPLIALPLLNNKTQDLVVASSKGDKKEISNEYQIFTKAFEAQAKRQPNAVALITNDAVMTYAELDTASNRLARYLISKGAQTDQVIGILMDRTPALIIGILAIVKAGAAYLPLDANYPSSRLAYMLSDSHALALLCTHDKFQAVFSDTPSERLPDVWFCDHQKTVAEISQYSSTPLNDQELTCPISGDNLVYVMYTSGSTGTPKGVAFIHNALGNLTKWKEDSLPSNNARILQYSPIGFDASAQEIASTFAGGSSLVLVDELTRRDPRALLQHMHQHDVKNLFAPFVVMASMAETSISFNSSGWPDEIFTAGEQLQITPDIREIFLKNPSSRLHNFYGPTEAHVVSNYSLPNDPNCWETFPPIGTPIWNTQLYILDSALNLVPDGIVGELYIAGVCLARGYLNKAPMTAERFIACPFSSTGGRMYRTGDLTVRRSGQIYYMGRIDQQIKLRGFRIELSEIETALLKYFDCFSAMAVLALEVNGIKSLVAYCVLYTDRPLPDEALIRNTLAKHLPEYMIPAYVIPLDQLPVTPHGKLDRRALPIPSGKVQSNTYRPPTDENETVLCQLFAELTGNAVVSIDDHFFSIGGHSLLAMQLIARLRSRHSLLVPLRTLFEFDTPELLAPYLETLDTEDEPMLVRGSGRITEA